MKYNNWKYFDKQLADKIMKQANKQLLFFKTKAVGRYTTPSSPKVKT
jgi:hypothetical protein